jgi:phospholipase/carboxylesterase
MAGELDGPRLSPKSGSAQQLVVFLHGYGADGNDLIDIGRAWQQMLPNAAFVSPHAPEPCGQAPVGRQWFPLTMRDPNERWLGVNKAAPTLAHFLDAELARHKLPPSALALVGFSQGTMMALHMGLRRAQRPRPSSAIPACLSCRLTWTLKNSPRRLRPARRSCSFMATATT